MPIDYARRLTGSKRCPQADQQLGALLSFVAGAINAGGFLTVQQYTSHMTGIVSHMADSVARGANHLLLAGLGSLLSFLAGSACSTMLVSFARQRRWQCEYAFPLLVEAGLLLCFGMVGARLSGIDGLFVSLTVMLLCFIMGLQNALITKLSKADIRTTHITGIITDLGIEIGKALYWNREGAAHPVQADRARLRMLAMLTLLFFLGGVVGSLGFRYLGHAATIPLALLLVALASVPAADDVVAYARRRLSAG